MHRAGEFWKYYIQSELSGKGGTYTGGEGYLYRWGKVPMQVGEGTHIGILPNLEDATPYLFDGVLNL